MSDELLWKVINIYLELQQSQSTGECTVIRSTGISLY